MKFDSPLMARLQAATQQLLKEGPLNATAAMRQATAGATAATSDARGFKDLNPAPEYAGKARQATRAEADSATTAKADSDAGATDLTGFLAGLGIRMPEGVKLPEGIAMPTGFRMPDDFKMPGGFRMAEGFTMPEGFQMPEGMTLPTGRGMHKRQAPPPLPDGAQFLSASYTNGGGTRAYKLYVPSSYRNEPLPLVVMLHGCTQDPDDFAAGTKMNAVAEETGCLVLYPCQSQQANSSRCWNWFSEADQGRDGGEPAIIAGMTRRVMADYAVDAGNVGVAGLSAGGAMAVTVGALYPELFHAVGVHSGLPHGAAQDLPGALQAMRQGASRRPGKGPAQPLIVFHGDKDHTVAAVNGEQILADGLLSHAGATASSAQAKAPGGRRYTRTVHTRPDGALAAEYWLLHGGGHAWTGGSPSGSYTDLTGPDASREMVRFFATVKADRQKACATSNEIVT